MNIWQKNGAGIVAFYNNLENNACINNYNYLITSYGNNFFIYSY